MQLFGKQQLINSKKGTKKRVILYIKCTQIDLNIHFFLREYFLSNNLRSTVDLFWPVPLPPVLRPTVFWYFNLHLWQLHFVHIMHANCAFLMYANNLEFMWLTSVITRRPAVGHSELNLNSHRCLIAAILVHS